MNSTLTTEELLKKHPRWTYTRTDRNGTRYFHDYTCNRCGGRGGWEGWPGFTCYDCGGSGKGQYPTVFKVYTPEHEAKLEKQREARARKREEERIAKCIAERPQNLVKAGFGLEDGTYVIYRAVGDTYPIKDELKALGCKFNKTVGWFSPTPIEGHDCQRLTETEVLQEVPEIAWRDKAEVEKLFQESQTPSPSKWVGEIGGRIEVSVHIDRAIEGVGFHGGVSYLYLMHDEEGNIYKWSSACYYCEGEDVKFKATIKDHSEYKGVAQTVLTRCTKVKE